MWRQINEDDLIATLSSDEIEAFKNDFSAGSDPVGVLCRRAAAMVRDYLRTNGNIRMSDDDTLVPESLISPAMDYVAIDVLKRLAIEPTDIRKEARKDAIAYFDKIASGRLTAESYGAAPTESTGGPAIQIVRSSRSRLSAAKMEGF